MLFLSQAWFEHVAQLNQQSHLNLSPSLNNLVINVVLDNQDNSFYIKEGKIWQGQDDNANSCITTDKTTLTKLAKTQDKSALLGAFMTGKLRVQGNLAALLSLNTNPSQEFKAFYKSLLAATQF